MPADFGLDAFKQSPIGRKIAPLLMDSETVRDMIALGRHDIPAVRAIGKPLLALGLRPKDEVPKKHIGRWVRQIMATAGWEPQRSGKLPRGHLFSTGAIYKPRSRIKG